MTAQLGLVSQDATLKIELLDGENLVTSAETEFQRNGLEVKNLPELIEEASTLLEENGDNLYEDKESGKAGQYSKEAYEAMEQERDEARAYKNANINFIRTSHYPVSEHMLDACDELGIYVEQETAVCFQGPWADVASKYEDYLPQFAEMIERDRNRPSILIWSLGNESNYDKIAAQSGAMPFRLRRIISATWIPAVPVSSASRTRASRGIWRISTASHYASVSGGLGSSKDSKPTLHDEFAHIPCYNLDELQRDVNVRNFWAKALKSDGKTSLRQTALWERPFGEASTMSSTFRKALRRDGSLIQTDRPPATASGAVCWMLI